PECVTFFDWSNIAKEWCAMARPADRQSTARLRMRIVRAFIVVPLWLKTTLGYGHRTCLWYLRAPSVAPALRFFQFIQFVNQYINRCVCCCVPLLPVDWQ